MTIQPSFDPQRSAEIRTLLIQTVDAHRPHPSRSKFAIVAALTGIALALAGGTAALALTGVLRFGSPEPAPLPPAPTTSTSPTPTPSPTPEPTERPIAVQSSPITYHDVRTHPSTPSWSLDLPGADVSCAQHHVYDIADGLALFQVGAKVVGDGSPDCNEATQEVSLSLVDTAAGRILWSRDWKWNAPPVYDVDVDVLGASRRVVIVDQALTGGPQEVVDLATGQKLADFAATKSGQTVNILPVGGESGDVVMTTPQGIVRVDPRDVTHPRWSTSIDASSIWLNPFSSIPRAEFMRVAISRPGTTSPNEDAYVDVETGALDPDVPAGDFLFPPGPPVVLSDYIGTSAPRTVTGLDTSGKPNWTLHNPSGATVTEVQSLTSGTVGVASANAGTGLLALTSVHTLSVIDGSTGQQLWSADATRCGYTSTPWAISPRVAAYLNSTQDELMLVLDGKTCTFSASTGEPHPLPDLHGSAPVGFGPGVTYLRPRLYYEGPVQAYDRETGEALWTANVPDFEQVKFAGGYLVSWKGTHVESMG